MLRPPEHTCSARARGRLALRVDDPSPSPWSTRTAPQARSIGQGRRRAERPRPRAGRSATRPAPWAATSPPWSTSPPTGSCASGCWSWSWRWRFAANTRWPRDPPRRRWRHDLRRSMCGRSSALGWPASSTQRSPGAAGAPRPAAEVQFRQQAGATVVLVKDDGHVIGALAVRGELHPEAAEVIARLRFGRLPHHHAHQRQPRYHHRCGGRRRHRRRARRTPPENKARIISELGTRQSTAMLGDGANDVPALATADLGSTMAATGLTPRSKPPTSLSWATICGTPPPRPCPPHRAATRRPSLGCSPP